MTIDDVVEAWRVNNAVNLELLDAIQDDWFELKPGKGKTIRSNFTHMITVRKMWLEEKLPKEAASIPKLDWKTATKDELKAGLAQSSEMMIALLRQKDAAQAKSKWTPALFLAYVIAHEAHHRSQIEVALRIGGHEPDDAFLYGLWEWSKK